MQLEKDCYYIDGNKKIIGPMKKEKSQRLDDYIWTDGIDNYRSTGQYDNVRSYHDLVSKVIFTVSKDDE